MQPGDEEAFVLKMMVEQHRMQDACWAESGIENEEFEVALLHYCQSDREVAMAMQMYMQKMRMMQGGGMPGMGR
jgi:hypothetical protein